ncbi:hypothetical protein HJFPF1_10291 [Paramyrothecium foliicola]|nr:hypothetical protein HJFPF1_10291 [Paramyrothecium foliicola]
MQLPTFSSIALLAATALLPAAQANFDIYRVEVTWINRAAITWQVWEAAPSCQFVWDNMHFFEDRSDVSGNKIGVRCKGSGCKAIAPIENIEQLEMHFANNPLLHFTLYKDRGFSMTGLDGNNYGNCFPFPNGDYDCPVVGALQRIVGRRKFRCLTRWSHWDLKVNL